MRISTLVYSIRQGIKGLIRNKAFSLASIGTIVACLFLFGIFYFVIENVKNISSSAEESVAITVFFKEDTTMDRKKEIEKQIKARSEVSYVEYISDEEAWNNFKKDYFSDDEKSIDEIYKDDNPLEGYDSYAVHLSDISKQASLVSFVEKLDGVREVNSDKKFADNLVSVKSAFAWVAFVLMVLLLGISVFLISITVLNGIVVRTEEIRIMKLIGATDGFVKGPFIVEGVIIGVVGAIIPLLLLWPAYTKIVQYAFDQFGYILPSGLKFVPTMEIFKVLTPIAIAVGIGIGFLGTIITLFRKLRTIA